jgi:hypothetical protein
VENESILAKHKNNENFIHITNELKTHIKQIKRSLEKLIKEYELPEGLEYTINLKNETLQVIKKK